ncbi:hypothetical protein TcasGA2_TC008607 [Tribolium castaneum]|uniref:Uncharacterized protein n=1 Tax=Tribolium castaneum TaxID=7070 RepID=D6WTM8_TRICA|nr:hypothetical protein TcasGA2_TC008607 [Tribolium castaneum]
MYSLILFVGIRKFENLESRLMNVDRGRFAAVDLLSSGTSTLELIAVGQLFVDEIRNIVICAKMLERHTRYQCDVDI